MSGILDSLLGAAGGGGKNPTAVIGDRLGSHGGLGGMVQAFEKGGLGEIAQSWVGKGANLPITAEQIEGVLGSGPLAEMAQKLGIDPKQAAGQLSSLLPQVIDQLTPDGTVTGGGLGGLGDILGKLRP